MAKKSKDEKSSDKKPGHAYKYCSIQQTTERVLGFNNNPGRLRLIRENEKIWGNATKLRYYFFDKKTDGENVVLSNGKTKWIPWTTSDTETKHRSCRVQDVERPRHRVGIRGSQNPRGSRSSNRIHAWRWRLVLRRTRHFEL